MSRKLKIPELVRNRALDAGSMGEAWLQNLDALVAELESRWHVAVGDVLSGGSQAFVARAEGEDGARYVLKINMPEAVDDAAFWQSADFLKRASGCGYVKLMEYDRENSACLMEELGRPLADFGYTAEKQMEIICQLLRGTWDVPSAGFREEHGCGDTGWFFDFVGARWEELNHPCPESVIERAFEFLKSRTAHERPEEFVLLHGDAHNTNVLEDLSAPGRFKLIDPDGVYYDKSYDLGVLMREWRDEYRADAVRKGRERCLYLHELTDVEPRAIFEWGLIQCVSTGLLIWNIRRDTGEELLNIAKAWTDAGMNL